MSIRVLEDHVVNQIAAGEVVERPASVLKELVENALDAGATQVDVLLKNGGRARIRVADDGCGMGRQDALMCLERFATSKIRRAEDLDAVGTLGFRGEALPSIAAVSRFELLTRLADAELGTRVRVEAGTLLDWSDAGCAAGTEVDIRSLFYNLPARRKFLRTRATELSHCLETITRQAMGRPDVGFVVQHEGREVLRTPVVGSVAARAGDLLGAHGRALVPARFEAEGFAVDALISPVGVHKSTAAGAQYLYVNGRYVRDGVLRRGIWEAYRDLVPKGRYPVVVLSLSLDPARVDVNVHPTKTEVRFRDPRDTTRVVGSGLRAALERHGIRRPVERSGARSGGPAGRVGASADAVAGPGAVARERDGEGAPAKRGEVTSAVSGVVASALSGPSAQPEASASAQPAAAPPPPLPGDLRFAHDRPALPSYAPPPPPPRQPSLPTMPTPAVPLDDSVGRLLPVPRFRDLQVIGQFRDTYILCQAAGELVIIDQHAAHERVMLHRLQRDRAERIGASQRLLTPVFVELPLAAATRLVAQAEVLDDLHLELAPVTGGVAVVGVPSALGDLDIVTLVRDIADELGADVVRGSGEDYVTHFLATMACHSAVRAHEPLSDYAMRALLASLDEVDFEVCAHGRPVAIRVSEAELERRFHRT